MKRESGGKKEKTRAAAPKAVAKTVAPDVFLSLVTQPGGDASTAPVLHGSNAAGDALVSTGLADLAASAVGPLIPLLPVGTIGLEVREALHRFDADARVPTLESGVVADNRTGEALGALSMRWLLAPDDFEATPSAAPPPTAIDPSRSQRVVLLGGRMTFQDRRQGVLRFFGTGRTQPVTVDGRSRLLFSGTATILEGLGSLLGARGALLLTGEVPPSGGIALTIGGRFEGDGPLTAADTLSPLSAGDEKSGESVFVFTSEDGQLRPARVGNDLGGASQLRSLVRVNARSGAVSGPLSFEATDRRCGVALDGVRRVLTFADVGGRPVGSIATASLEGTAFRDTRGGEPVRRLIAAGPVTDGTGALAGAVGSIALDTIVDGAGRSSSFYVLRLTDPAGAFRARSNEVSMSLSAHSSTAGPLAGPPMDFEENNGTRMNDTDRAIVAYADRTLAEGIDTLRWFEEKDRGGGNYAKTFDVVREFNGDDRNFAFFDTAPVAGRPQPVMGIVQEMFYDRQKHAGPEAVRDQLREFVLRYFMRVSHLRQPEAYAGPARTRPTPIQRALSWLPDEAERRVGFGYQQLYYKLVGSGKVGKFREDEQRAIVDLRDVGKLYAWILLKVDIFDFNLSFAPFGNEAMKFQMPMKEQTYLVMGPRFITNKENPEPGVLAEYGYGYAFVPYAPHPTAIAYGPGNFAVAIQTVNFRLMQSGEIRARAAFVVNRPERIAKIDIDPINWGFQMADVMTFNMASRLMGPLKSVVGRLPLRVSGVDPIQTYIWMANAMTAGMAGKQLGITMESLERRMLVQHFMQHYAMLINSLLVWRMIPDWTAHEQLPEYCNKGIRC